MAASETNPDPSLNDVESNVDKARNLAEEARRRATEAAQRGAPQAEEGIKSVGDGARKIGEEPRRRIGDAAEDLSQGVQSTGRRIGEGISGVGEGFRRRVSEVAQDAGEVTRRRIGDTEENLSINARPVAASADRVEPDANRRNVDAAPNIGDDLIEDEAPVRSNPDPYVRSTRTASQSTESFLMGDPPAPEPVPPPKKGLWFGQKLPLAVLTVLLTLCALAMGVTYLLTSLSGGRSVSTGLPPASGLVTNTLSNTARITNTVGSVITATNRLTTAVGSVISTVANANVTGTVGNISGTLRPVTGTITLPVVSGGSGAAASTPAVAAAAASTPTPQPSFWQRLLSLIGLGPRTPAVIPAPVATAVAGSVAKPAASPLATIAAATGTNTTSAGASGAVTATQRAPTTTVTSTSGQVTTTTSVTGTTGGGATSGAGTTGSTGAVTGTTGSGATAGASGAGTGTTTGSGTTTPGAGDNAATGATAGATEVPKQIPTTGVAANGNFRVCAAANFGGGECASSAAVLPRTINRVYASWDAGFVAGRNFDVVWYGADHGRMIPVQWYDCNWSAAKGTHTCTSRPNGAGAFSLANDSSAYIQANPTKWGPTVPVNQYRVELQINGQVLAQQAFSVK